MAAVRSRARSRASTIRYLAAVLPRSAVGSNATSWRQIYRPRPDPTPSHDGATPRHQPAPSRHPRPRKRDSRALVPLLRRRHAHKRTSMHGHGVVDLRSEEGGAQLGHGLSVWSRGARPRRYDAADSAAGVPLSATPAPARQPAHARGTSRPGRRRRSRAHCTRTPFAGRRTGTSWRTTPPAAPSAAVPRRPANPDVPRGPPDSDRKRSITRTSPSTATGPVPGAVSRRSDAANSLAVSVARRSASVGGPAGPPVAVPAVRRGVGQVHRDHRFVTL